MAVRMPPSPTGPALDPTFGESRAYFFAQPCPRCLFDGGNAGNNAREFCRSCGYSWQVIPAEVPAAEPGDDLGTVSLTIDRLRRFLHGPPTAADRAEARRRLDRLAERTYRS